MAPPIRIEWLERRDASDLVQALAVRGLVGVLEADGARYAVSVSDPHEDVDRLVAEVVSAVEAWLADRGRETIGVRVGEATRTVGAPAGLDEMLRAGIASAPDRLSQSGS